MKRGKQTCRILKEIRKQIAEANDIEFITSECQYQGDCLGTCPKCESEVRYLEHQLEYKRMAGKAITVLGLSAGLLTLTPTEAEAQKQKVVKVEDIELVEDSTWIKLMEQTRNDAKRNIERERKEKGEVFWGMRYQMPTYPGGALELFKYIEKNTQYPETETCISGCVTVTFTVEKNGNISNAKVLQSVHSLLDAEAIRVVNSMPKWIPGKMNGKAIEAKFTVPINFKIVSPQVTDTEILETSTEIMKQQPPIIVVKGKVIDKQNEALSGAFVREGKKDKNGTVTDREGKFELKISPKHPLIISFVGMKTQKLKLNKYISPYITVVLEDDNMILGEAVVTEYN